MKLADMRELTVDELAQQINQTRKELFEARFKHSLQQLENTALLQQQKKRIAQLSTLLQQKQAAEGKRS